MITIIKFLYIIYSYYMGRLRFTPKTCPQLLCAVTL